jgi:hypothetical protein
MGVSERFRGRFFGRLVVALSVATVLFSCASARAATARTEHPGQLGTVRPNAYGNLDCNGFSPIQHPVKSDMVCRDVRDSSESDGRFYENNHYIGHDEPDLNFISSRPGSGSDSTWTFTLGRDPAANPTVGHPGSDVSHYFELTPAMWLSMNLCDPQSYPLTACTPSSDSNAPSADQLGGGSAFLELQFYPPGFAPFDDSISLDNTHWGAAMAIDSFEAKPGFVDINQNCPEPANFAYIQRNGVPTGPASPQLANLASFTPNSQTLLMNPGDRIQVHIFDAPASGGGKALEALVDDLTTQQSGVMQASAANGFMNTSYKNCEGIPFNFEPAYNTAKVGNVSPWGAGTQVISTSVETGHFTPCSSLTDPAEQPITADLADPFFNDCHGAYESAAPGGDGPGTVEPTDGPCYPQGDTHRGLAAGSPNLVTGCVDFAAGGDLDFDGTPYWTEWPTSTTPSTTPATLQYHPPTTGADQAEYAQFQSQTDLGFVESTCTPETPSGCTTPPPNAPGHFYPYWTLSGQCDWEFGNVTNGNTFGGDAQYGSAPSAKLFPDFLGEFHNVTCS